MVRIPTDRPPTHPGEMLLEEFLTPLTITPQELSTAIHVSAQEIQQLVQGQCALTPGVALRLAKYFDVSAAFWMNLQLRWDLYFALETEAEELAKIQPRTA